MNGNTQYYKKAMSSALNMCPSLSSVRGSQADLISSNFWGKNLCGKIAEPHTSSSASSSGGPLLQCPDLCFFPGRQVFQHRYSHRPLWLQMAAANFNHGLTGGFLQFRCAYLWSLCSENFIAIMPQHHLPYPVFYLS